MIGDKRTEEQKKQMTGDKRTEAVVIVSTETRVQIGEDLQNHFAFRLLFHFGILGLCHDTHAGQCQGNKRFFHHIVLSFCLDTAKVGV